MIEHEPSAETRDCTFCGIIEGKSPSTPILSDENAVSFMSLEGHPLVVPRKHITKIDSEEAEEGLSQAFNLASKLVVAVESAYHATGVNVVSNIGKSAGQEVEHLHVHVLPRIEGDGKLKLGKLLEVEKDVRENLANSIKSRLLPPTSS